VQYLESGQKNINGWKVGPFGDSAFYNGDWLKRAAAAKAGIYGNDGAEAMYPMTRRCPTVSRSTAASTTTHHLCSGAVPAMNMPSGRLRCMTARASSDQEPINRYLINSPMLPNMKKTRTARSRLHP